MNVRIDYQPPGERPSRRRRKQPRRRGRALALAAGGSVLVMLGVLKCGATPTSNSPDAEGERPAAAPEMARGGATAAAVLATRNVSGLPRGFPRSEEGAVEAGASFASSVFVLHRMSSGDRWAYAQDAMTNPPSKRLLDTDAVAFRANHGLSETGHVLDASGDVVQGARFVSECHPALGAYRVEDSAEERYEVDFWLPCLLGTVDRDGRAVELRARWQMGRMVLRWDDGDWRVDELTRGPFNEPVTPPDDSAIATSLSQRAALLGDGWLAFADARESRPDETRPEAGR